MQTIAGQRVPLDFVVNWTVANLYFVREAITDTARVPHGPETTVLRNRLRFGRRTGSSNFSKNRPLVRGEKLILDLSPFVVPRFKLLKILVPEKREKRKGKKSTNESTRLSSSSFAERSRETNIGGHFYLPLSAINTTFPCYRSYEIGLEIGGGIQGRRNAKFAPGERREGWW